MAALAADIARTELLTTHIVHLPGNCCHAGPTSPPSPWPSPTDKPSSVNQSAACLP